MTAIDNHQSQLKQSSWMLPVVADIIRFEYEIAIRGDKEKRMLIEIVHRGFWGALLSDNPALARSHFTHLAVEYSVIGLDLMNAEAIDVGIMDNISEMVLVRSKTQRTKSRSELKKLIQAAVLRGEVNGWWYAQY